MKIIDSVAAVFCQGGEVFSVRRQSHLDAFPGYDSFPGGKIDRSDGEGPRTWTGLQERPVAEGNALVREIEEELAFSLPEGGESGLVTAVSYLATALAPALMPVRFRLHFFRIDLKARPTFTPDVGEFSDTIWATPEALLERFAQGDSLMVPPMRWVLQALAERPEATGLGDLSPQYDEERLVPKLEPLQGIQQLAVPSNTLPPADRTNAFLIGDAAAPTVLVDPSPKSPEVLERLLRTLEGETVSLVFLTHHHPDHHQFAPELARALQVPIGLSLDTQARIEQQQGTDYFSGCSLIHFKEGDTVTRWKEESVQVYEVPGHDAGQLALAPESLRWFLVGDLIQGVGTVVIREPEGDMAAYFRTLERVIALDPAVILPSHGLLMRSTFRLQATLKHRQEREATLLSLHQAGHSEEAILHQVYPGLDARLLPLARHNITSHLKKLRQEQRI